VITAAVLVGVALAVAGPDLVTVGAAVCSGRHVPRVVGLIACITAAHTVLVVAGLRGMS
jgi:hypothetical protein